VLRAAHARGIDTALLLVVVGLLLIGLPAIYSASYVVEGSGKVIRQLVFAALGGVGLTVLACIDYRIWSRSRRVFYAIILVALLLTLLIAEPINGARSWIGHGALRVQPSEFAKLLLILAFASWLTRIGPAIRTWPVMVKGLLYVGAPVLLVLAQPDFGTAMVLCAIWLVMTMVAGARWWMLLAVVLAGIGLFTLAWHVDLIKPYQKKRLDFIHADPAGNGYHQRQASIAIGSGQFWGKGYRQSSQARRGFLPEQDTDFIYAVIAEEFGFLGSIVVLGLFLFMLFRLISSAEQAETSFGRLILAGVMAMLAVHAVINIGMCLTLLPVTGVPLPFVSYGGSNLVTNLLAIGIALNISRHREPRRAWAGNEALVRL
jgi:rod shape determining protein RodA